MNKLYRIYTEDVNREALEAIVAVYFDGFTLIEASGYWQGKRERSLIIEVITPYGANVHQCAEHIREHNKQQSVLVIEQSIDRISFV